MDRWLVKVFWDIKLHINILLTFCLNYDHQSLFTHRNENLQEAATPQFPLECLFNQRQLFLQMCCLCSLWNFGETIEDRRFLLSKDIFPLSVDALLLQTVPLKETSHIDISSMVVNVNETAIGCFAGLVECDSNIQEKVSNMPAVVNKLLFMIDRYQSEPAGYSLFSSQVASNALFYCTFNVKSAQSLVNCGAVEKLLHITKAFLNDKDGNTPLRYYCCLSLARMCSAPLVKLDIDTCVAIHELIDLFLDSHVPNEISEWEEKSSYVWMTMVPLVHLAFAGRIENNRQRSSSTQKLGIFSLVHMLSIKENQQLALSENLFPYLVCLSWHLQCEWKEKLRTVLANNVFTPPSLKVAAKSVLALTRGLDMVFNL